MNKAKKVFAWIGAVAGVAVLAVVLFYLLMFVYLTLSEYKPKDRENISVLGESSKMLSEGSSFTIASWNIGYGALGDNADFFMDGGKSVHTASKKRVKENMNALVSELKKSDADIFFLQEADLKATRSHSINEKEFIAKAFPEYSNSFAKNFKVGFLPYPLPMIGHVDAGIATFSSFKTDSAERIQLPCPFTWPLRIANLKRCVLVNYVPLNDSEKKLVLVNLHLEAYDSGEGKIAQTKLLREILQTEADKGNYVIAGGDFNQTFSSVDLKDFPVLEGMWIPGIIDESEFSADWQFVMDSENASCRSLDKVYAGADKSNFQYYIIDGFIVSKNIQIDEVHTANLDFKASDHNPVVMKVTLK